MSRPLSISARNACRELPPSRWRTSGLSRQHVPRRAQCVIFKITAAVRFKTEQEIAWNQQNQHTQKKITRIIKSRLDNFHKSSPRRRSTSTFSFLFILLLSWLQGRFCFEYQILLKLHFRKCDSQTTRKSRTLKTFSVECAQHSIGLLSTVHANLLDYMKPCQGSGTPSYVFNHYKCTSEKSQMKRQLLHIQYKGLLKRRWKWKNQKTQESLIIGQTEPFNPLIFPTTIDRKSTRWCFSPRRFTLVGLPAGGKFAWVTAHYW